MTREEFNALKSRVDTAADMFSKMDSDGALQAGIQKCYLTVHNADDVRTSGVRIKEQDAVRTIVLAQLNDELKELAQKIAEF